MIKFVDGPSDRRGEDGAGAGHGGGGGGHPGEQEHLPRQPLRAAVLRGPCALLPWHSKQTGMSRLCASVLQ